jgi:hypothetical protein
MPPFAKYIQNSAKGIQNTRYREEMAADAPASDIPEDNP